MRAAGFKAAFYKRCAGGKSLEHLVVCDATAVGVDVGRKTLAIVGIAAVPGIDRAAVGQSGAKNKCVVGSDGRTRAKLLDKMTVRFVGFADDHRTTRILIQSVHNSRAPFAAGGNASLAV